MFARLINWGKTFYQTATQTASLELKTSKFLNEDAQIRETFIFNTINLAPKYCLAKLLESSTHVLTSPTG